MIDATTATAPLLPAADQEAQPSASVTGVGRWRSPWERSYSGLRRWCSWWPPRRLLIRCFSAARMAVHTGACRASIAKSVGARNPSLGRTPGANGL